ncbi:Macrophage mannose receptor 1 [Nibea albiflora]|uniref:Macrophage mannose receptor 1 n=1 Tax=Nibea albiflora TaxID=240163 RepID=A0ACB7EVZ6_NIBAL|nr:Macrophage mannose receptor 1 [Nibea albiflora]
MMERVFLGFLYFAGWCISTCLLRQYHYVAGPLNWTEAQTYCRKTYTDLVTIRSHEEMNQLFRTVSSAGVKSADVWTGLYSKIDWKWSNGYRGDGAEYKNWNNNPDNEPDFYGAAQFCVCVGNDGRWWDDGCDKKHPFICITGTESEFVFVNENMNWSDAQKYCRENYADLATVRNVTENTKIRILVPSKKWAWIAPVKRQVVKLRIKSSVDLNRADVKANMLRKNWNDYSDNEPDFAAAAQFCVCVGNDGGWWDTSCSLEYQFICITGTESEFAFVNETMSWSDAQKYCRENYADLATVRNVTENTEIRMMMSTTNFAWIGLFRDPNMYWSDGSNFTHLSVSTKEVLGSKRVICVFATMMSEGKLWFTGCDKRLGFVCYGPPPPAPVKRQVVKLRIKSSVDLNRADVKANMLRKLQDKLKKEGVSGVTLKWREQPDGKVFHKEGKRKKTEL